MPEGFLNPAFHCWSSKIIDESFLRPVTSFFLLLMFFGLVTVCYLITRGFEKDLRLGLASSGDRRESSQKTPLVPRS